MTAAERVLDIARSYIGVKESPANSNNVIFNTHYYGREVYDGLWGLRFPWCCTFQWDIFRMAGCSALFYGGKKTASCPTLYGFHRQKGQIVPFEEGKPGDIVLMSWYAKRNADHVGLLEANNGSTLTTIEGNTSVGNNGNGGMVMRRTRKKSEVLAIIRPAYETLKEENEMTEKEINDLVDKRVKEAVEAAIEPLNKTITKLVKGVFPKIHTNEENLPGWAKGAVRKLRLAEVIQGNKADEICLIDGAMNLGTAVAMSRVLDKTSPKVFKHIGDVPEFWRKEIAALEAAGALKGDSTGAVNLTETEAKVLAVVARLEGLVETGKDV